MESTGARVVDPSLKQAAVVGVPLNQLSDGSAPVINVMVCRVWDSANSYGKYLSTDFLVCDKEDLKADVVSKNFMPFGGGTSQRAGAKFAKVLMVTLLHVLVTKYTWGKIKGGDVARTPILTFKNRLRIKVIEKEC